MARRTWHPCPSDRASGTGSVGMILLHSSASVWGARASCCVAWATLDLPPLLPHRNSELFFVLAEFCKGVCDQRSEGAGGRLHQERAEEGWRGQLRCSDRVAPAPHLRAICLLHLGGDCHLRVTSPPGRRSHERRRRHQCVQTPPLHSCLPPPPRRPSVTLSSSPGIIRYLPPFCFKEKSSWCHGHAHHPIPGASVSGP